MLIIVKFCRKHYFGQNWELLSWGEQEVELLALFHNNNAPGQHSSRVSWWRFSELLRLICCKNASGREKKTLGFLSWDGGTVATTHKTGRPPALTGLEETPEKRTSRVQHRFATRSCQCHHLLPLILFAFLGVLRNDHITRLETLKAGQTNWIRWIHGF